MVRLIDRYGNRLVGVLTSGLFALALLAFSRVNGMIFLLLAFFAVRTLGQGSMMMVNTTVIAQWFRQRRGRMVGLSFLVFAIFRGFFVPALQDVLEVYDWRAVLVMLALVVGLVIMPIMWLFLRDRPEQFGLLPDGADERAPTTVITDEDNWTLAEARRTMLFWEFAAGRWLSPAFGTGLIFHQVSLFEELGYAPGVAADTFGRIAFISAGVTLVIGYLVDRLHPTRVLAIQLTALVSCMALAMIMTESWMLLGYAAAFGVVLGSGGVLDSTVLANVFGRLHQGAIRGFAFTIVVTGTAIGPILFGLSYDYLGSYNPILIAGIVISIIPFVLSFFTPLPTHDVTTNPDA